MNLAKSSLHSLNTGLLFLDFKKTSLEPEYEAMDSISKEHFVIQTRYQYSRDLIRAVSEAVLTTELEKSFETSISVNGKIFESEEILTYFDGIFLDYIHQIKDKLFRLIWWMMQKESMKTIPEEPTELKMKNFKIYKGTLEKIGIYDLMSVWNQEGNGGISVALRKRSQHHHFTSKLQLNPNFQKIKMSRTMLAPLSAQTLTEYGKAKIKQLGEDSYEKFTTETKQKHLDTLKLIEKNISEICLKLIKFYSVPTDEKEHAKIANDYADGQKKFDVTNEASYEKIPKELDGALKFFVSSCKDLLKKHLVSIYLTGSVPRGEYIHDSSDINVIIVTDFDSHDLSLKDADPRLNVLLFSKQDFLGDRGKKYRFICWSDGILLYGKKLEFNKKDFPKPGTLLTLLLNDEFIKELKDLLNQVEKLKNPDKKSLHLYSVKAARIMLHFIFGVAMANKPYYTSSMNKKVKYILDQFPLEKKTTSNMYGVYLGGYIKQENFPEIVNSFIDRETPAYEKMLAMAKNESK